MRGEGDVSLWRAAKKADHAAVRQIAAKKPQLLDQFHPTKGSTPLMAAARHRHGAETVRALLEYGANMDLAERSKRSNTVLHTAAYCGHVTTIEYLLRAGADAFVLNRRGHTALDVAWLRHQKEAAMVFTVHTFVYSGWLMINHVSRLPFWKRYWCVLLASNNERSAVDMLLFRSPSDLWPKTVLMIEGTPSIQQPDNQPNREPSSSPAVNRPMTPEMASHALVQALSTWTVKPFRFDLDRPVMVQKLRRHRFSRDPHTRHGFIQTREILFAAESDKSRLEWMRVLPTCQVSSTSLASMSSNPIATAGSFSDHLHQSLELLDAREARSDPSAPLYNSMIYSEDVIAYSMTAEQSLAATKSQELEPPFRADCVICMDAPRDTVCVPCGHIAGCHACLCSITQAVGSAPCCPICRAHVEAVVKVFDC